MGRMRRVGSVAIVAVAAVTAAACRGGPRSLVRASGPPIEWSPGRAEAANGAPPGFTAASVCGSDTETYLAELAHVAPTAAKVLHEWGDIVPGGKQVLASGTIAATHLGPADLATSHPYGDDLSMDVAVDPPFAPFNRALGPREGAPGRQHVEIAAGFIPHLPRPSSARTGQTWRQLSDFNLTGFQPGFDQPAIGDRALVMGRWIVDCGHESYQTELHPMAFLAWARRRGAASVARAYFNPYHDTELYSADATVLGRVDDPGRATRPDVKQFPPFIVDEVIRVASGAEDHPRIQELIDATHASPVPWRVCAPAGTSGHALAIDYDIVARPGVQVTVRPDRAAGCAVVETALTRQYRPAPAQLRSCVLPWTYLNELAQGDLNSPVDVKGLIQSNVPAALRPRFEHDPDTTCADALAGPVVHAEPVGRSLRIDGDQPFPFYGVVSVQLTS